MALRYFTFLAAISALSCTAIEDLTGNNPVIDSQNVNLAQYHRDLAQCQNYAEEVEIARKAGISATAGAIIGGVFGAVWGNSDTAKRGAGIGAVGGTARGLNEGVREQEIVIKRCLIGRGYRVLN
ncbi:MAG: glycine zipper family protein [Gammaproteobacteria bacterium]|nr:glycine zipper family protein [Gammaproteobacteria bacterium]